MPRLSGLLCRCAPGVALAWSLACGAPAARSPGATPRVVTPGAVAQPPSAGPQVVWRADQQRLLVAGLPAIARDGAVVVLAEVAGDGGRGNPNLAIVVRDRTDRELERRVILAPAEAETLIGADGPGPALRERIAAGDALLRALHARHHLAPLAPMEVPPPAPRDERHEPLTATDGRHTVMWSPSRLVIMAGAAPLLDAPTPAGWLATPEDRGCTNPAFLGAAAIAPALRAVVVTIAYLGTDTCWEPDAQQHVVTW